MSWIECVRAKRAKEVRALRESYRREVAALEQKLQIAASSPGKWAKGAGHAV